MSRPLNSATSLIEVRQSNKDGAIGKKVPKETFAWRFRNGPPCLSACLHLVLNLLLWDYYYRKTLFPSLNQLVHIVFGLESQFLSHENETTSPWQRNYLIKTLQQLRSHISHHCPVLPQLAFVSKMALLWMIAWSLLGFFFFFLSLEYWSNTTENWENVWPSFQKFMLCDVDPRILIMDARNLTYHLKNVTIYL